MAFQKIGVVGGGAWGTALALSARRAGRDVLIWAYELETVQEINEHRANRVYLPGVNIDRAIRATARSADMATCDLLLMAVPTQFTRAISAEIGPYLQPGTPVLACAKGFEQETGLFLTEVLAQTLPEAMLGVLSGPSFAAEVARNLPAALTLAVADEAHGSELAEALGHRNFRLYWTDDVRGVQIGGAVKNVLAIAAGIVVGRGLGESAHAAVTTRGFAELRRFGAALGGRPETLTGLSGLGDLMLTCSSAKSRNMSLGKALGKGQTLADVLGARRSVSEGVHTAQAVVELARRQEVEMPICEAVYEVLCERMSIDAAIESLLSRPAKAEPESLARSAG
ncbi:MAG: NAD(P)H-dependent glycerol-3-phosphate dehydrogenase [Dichotomicrobium sp.]